MKKEPRTAFISYTRQGGAVAAERVRDLLLSHGIKPWQDRTHLRGGDDFWQQIEGAIRCCSYLVMVLTPDAFGEERRILRREWYTARSAGTCVVPIKGGADLNLSDEALPQWLKARHVVDLDQPAEVDTLIQQLQSECQVDRVPFMAEDLPANYTVRAGLLDSLRNVLLATDRSRVALTTAVRGPGGFGKTMLAQAICHDDRVIASFEHGILWVTLGEQPRMADKLSMLYTALTDEDRRFDDNDAARAALAERLRTKRCLIVIDDVWDYSDLEPLLDGARESVRLITTRQTSVAAQANAVDVPVNEMTTAEAVAMLAASLPGTNVGRGALTEVAQRLGEWPVLLNLFAGHVRESIRYGQSGASAVSDLLSELEELGATAFDRASASDRRQAVDATLGVSLERLSAAEKARCAELAIFPEDVAIPLAVVGDVWHASEVDTRRTLRRLADLGLISLDLGARSIGVHDLIRKYLQRQLDRPEAEVHAALVDAWPDPPGLPHEYAWQWFTYHLARAGRIDALRRWLTDPRFLAARLEKHGLGALTDDFDYLDDRDVVRLVQAALQMDAQAIFGDSGQLLTQLLGRLGRGIAPEIDRLLDAARGAMTRPWLRPVQNVLYPPGGGLVRKIRGYAGGHEGTVRSIAMDAHARWAVTAGNSTQDQAVIIWNLRNGDRQKLPGLALPGSVTPLALTSNGGRALVATGDEIRLLQTSDASTLVTHSNDGVDVTAIGMSRDGRLAAWGAADGLVSICAIAEGPPRQLGRHAGLVLAIDLSRDGRIAASATEDDITSWDVETGREVATIEGVGFVPDGFARCFRIADDGSVLWAGPSSIERDPAGWTTLGTPALKRWIPGEPTFTMSQHPDVSAYLAVSATGRRALVRRSSGGPEELAVYDLEGLPRILPLPNLGRGVSTAGIDAAGRFAASADYEHDLFVWDLDRLVDPLPQPTAAAWHDMTFDGFSTDGQMAVFTGADGVKAAIDVETGVRIDTGVVPEIWRDSAEPASPGVDAGGQGDRVAGKGSARGGKTRANDYPVDDFGRSRGHTATVNDRRRAPNGMLEATVSHDGTLRVWDVGRDKSVASFTSDVSLARCHWSPDGRTIAVIAGERTYLLRVEGVEADGEHT